MSKFARYIETRNVRFDMIQAAIKEFEGKRPEYAYQAGFYLSQLMSLAADRQDTTEDLIRALQAVSK
jgi:hypothetical protein